MRPHQELAIAAGMLFSRILFIPFTRYTSPTEHLAIGAISAGVFLLFLAAQRARGGTTGRP